LSTAKGKWNKERSIEEILLNINKEVIEAYQCYKDSETDSPNLYPGFYFKDGKPVGFSIELADIFIYIADICAFYRIDLETAIYAKINHNKKEIVNK